MKKITLFCILLIACVSGAFGQATSYSEAPPFDNSTSGNRSPNGTTAHTYMRAGSLVLATELTNIANNATLTSFGFTLNSGAVTSAATGNFTLYLQNTTDVAYNKSATFATAITGMTQVYASSMTIPISAGATSVVVTLSSPFVYTGGGIYVLYDWYSPGPYSSAAAVYRCNSGGLINGCNSAAATGSAPPTLGASNFRPCFLFGVANSFTNDIQFVGIEAPGRVTSMFNTPHNIRAIIKNASSVTNNNIVVSLNVGGANTFVDTQTITSLASGATSTVTFAAFNPLLQGLNTISVTVPSDQNNTNNLGTYTQSVVCNEWAMNPAATGAVSYTQGSVGFNTGSGIIAVTYSNPVTSTLTGIRGSISTNTPAIGNQSWGVLMSSAGVILATTNTITTTSAMLGTFVTYTFSTPQNMAASTIYYMGFAQPANLSLGYFPMGTYNNSYVPFMNYVTTTTLGGVTTALPSNLGYFGIEAIFLPNIPIVAASQVVTCGATANLTVTGVPNYTWTNGPVSTSFAVTPTVNSTYTVTATNSLGCVAEKTVMVTVNPLPVTAASSASIICLGDPVTITATGAPTFSWNAGPNQTAASFTDTPSTTTTYSVVGTNSAGCMNVNSVMVTVTSFSNLTVSSQSVVLCLGNSLTLTAAGANTYTWETGSNTSTTQSIQETPTAGGIFTVTGADGLGCKQAQTITVTVNSFTPTVPSNTAICLGSQIMLTASGAAPNSYTWSPNFPFSSITVSPGITTAYSVIAIGANGCLGYAATTVSVNANPNLTVTANRQQMCRGENNTISVSGASNYTWSSGQNTPTISMTATISLNYVYTVTGIDANGCSDIKSITIVVNACTGLDSHAQGQAISMYPNPTSGLLTIELSSSNAVARVIDVLGREAMQQNLQGGHSVLNLQELPNGVYFVRVEEGGKTLGITRIVKQ